MENNKEPIVVFEHQSKKLIFSTPNKFCQWRAKTLLTKEPETIGWLRTFQPDDIFWDIGANIGLYSVYAAIISGCKTFAFEPESQNYAILNKNIYFNRLHELLIAFPIGISDQTKVTNLNLSKLEPGFSGHSIADSPHALHQGCVSFTIDNLIDMGLPCPTHLKIDIDGLEPQVIKGAARNIDKIKTILIELEHKNPAHITLIQEMRNLGFIFDPEQVARTARTHGDLFEDYREYIFKRP